MGLLLFSKMVREIIATKDEMGMRIILVTQIIKNRVFLTIRGVPKALKAPLLAAILKVSRVAEDKGEFKKKVMQKKGGWLILEDPDAKKPETKKEIEETEEKLMLKQIEGLKMKGFTIQNE